MWPLECISHLFHHRPVMSIWGSGHLLGEALISCGCTSYHSSLQHKHCLTSGRETNEQSRWYKSLGHQFMKFSYAFTIWSVQITSFLSLGKWVMISYSKIYESSVHLMVLLYKKICGFSVILRLMITTMYLLGVKNRLEVNKLYLIA